MLAVPGVYALFYYSGYGFNYEGRTQLVGVDAVPPLHYKYTIDVDMVEYSMKEKLSRAVVVIDFNMIEFG